MSFGGYSNTDYDALADQLVGETDMDKRLDIYKQMEQILLLDDCAFAPIYYATKQVLLQTGLRIIVLPLLVQVLSLSGLTSMEKISNRAQLVEGNA